MNNKEFIYRMAKLGAIVWVLTRPIKNVDAFYKNMTKG